MDVKSIIRCFWLGLICLLLLPLCEAGNASRQQISLNGTWEFKLKGASGNAEWSPIVVPGHWELAGHSAPNWQEARPETGLYRRDVHIPVAWADMRIFLRFEGVYQDASVKWDDNPLGRHESGYTAFEYEITSFAKPGATAELSLEVNKAGPHHDMDCLDFWALGGIYRDVTLLARPRHHTAEWSYQVSWHPVSATLRVAGRADPALIDQSVAVRARLFDGSAEKAWVESPLPADGKFVLSLNVHNPLPWTAETPNLYTLQLELIREGKVFDHVQKNIGLREVSIKDGKLLVNGKPIRIRGVARHDLWPDTGRAVPAEVSKNDIMMMKRNGFNAVRTAHHPSEPAFLEWADLVGIYILSNIPMSNVHRMLNDERNLPAALLRVRETIGRDINHPSVIIWALGNENPLCKLHAPLYAKIKQLDPTRPVLMPDYSGQGAIPDFNSRHYRGVEGSLKYSRMDLRKPFIATEFNHSAFGGGGGFGNVWDVFDREPNAIGFTIWEWMDQGIVHNYQLGWPATVRYYPKKQKASQFPSGFGPGDSATPTRIDLVWKGSRGKYNFIIHQYPTSSPESIEISCDGRFVGYYRSATQAATFTFPVNLNFKGEHTLHLAWDHSGGGHWFDALSLVNEKGKAVWSIGEKDDSYAEFLNDMEERKTDEPHLDSRHFWGTDGMLDPYRNPGEEFPLAVAVVAPVQLKPMGRVDLNNFRWRMSVDNRMDFTALKNTPTQWRVQFFNERRTWTQTWPGPLLTLPPRGSDEFDLDISFLKDIQPQPSALEWVVLSQGEDEAPGVGARELGRVFANLSFCAPMRESSFKEIKVERDENSILLICGKVTLEFESSAGGLVAYKKGRRTLINDCVGVGVWRPALRHEEEFWPTIWSGRSFWNSELKGEIVRRPVSMELVQERDNVRVVCVNDYVGSASPDGLLMQGREEYTIFGNGGFRVDGEWSWKGPAVQLRRIGFDLCLSSDLTQVVWSGPGAQNTYSGRKAGYPDRIHILDRSSGFFDGNKTDTQWMRLSDNKHKTILTLTPGHAADCDLLDLGAAIMLRVSDNRGCGNKYRPPAEAHQLRVETGKVMRASLLVEIE
jgi:Glycosyl hydrolases family 2, TIM barrel domain/Glycosyl hydrolases family 2, sugar binding domain/Glycosyl hydrolases family 2/Beta galactosidase small chain